MYKRSMYQICSTCMRIPVTVYFRYMFTFSTHIDILQSVFVVVFLVFRKLDLWEEWFILYFVVITLLLLSNYYIPYYIFGIRWEEMTNDFISSIQVIRIKWNWKLLWTFKMLTSRYPRRRVIRVRDNDAGLCLFLQLI